MSETRYWESSASSTSPTIINIVRTRSSTIQLPKLVSITDFGNIGSAHLWASKMPDDDLYIISMRGGVCYENCTFWKK